MKWKVADLSRIGFWCDVRGRRPRCDVDGPLKKRLRGRKIRNCGLGPLKKGTDLVLLCCCVDWWCVQFPETFLWLSRSVYQPKMCILLLSGMNICPLSGCLHMSFRVRCMDVLLFFAAVVCVSMCSTLFLSHLVQVSGVRIPVLRFFRLSS